MVPSPHTLAELLAASDNGEVSAKEALYAELYAELHRIARRELARSASPVTLSPTTLLHEAYLNISIREGAVFPDQPHFLAYAAKAMRGLIIDHVRNRRSQKRGGLFELTSLENNDGNVSASVRELTELSDALDELAKAEPALAELVDLKFFCGFAFTEIAVMRGVSERTILRQWEKARIFLHRSIRADLSV
jgi:RNA polymerase sigma factor (TIGR02999 family)